MRGYGIFGIGIEIAGVVNRANTAMFKNTLLLNDGDGYFYFPPTPAPD